MAQTDYLGNGPVEVWHSGADFRMLTYHGHGSEARRPSVRAAHWSGTATERQAARTYGAGHDDRRSGAMWITDWTVRAACKGTDPDELFVQGAAQNRAKLICRGCPVRTECLADALDNRIEFRVWGGMTERERRALLRRRPDVKSWRALLETAKEEYYRSSTVDELVAS